MLRNQRINGLVEKCAEILGTEHTEVITTGLTHTYTNNARNFTLANNELTAKRGGRSIVETSYRTFVHHGDSYY